MQILREGLFKNDELGDNRLPVHILSPYDFLDIENFDLTASMIKLNNNLLEGRIEVCVVFVG
jgi:hypothetical protein